MDEDPKTIIQIMGMIISGIVSIIILLISISYIKLFSTSQNNPSTPIKILSLIANLSAFIGSIFLFTMFTRAFVEAQDTTKSLCQFISNICLNIMSISSYSIFLIRLNNTFKGSFLAISHKINILLGLFLILYISAYMLINCHVIDHQCMEKGIVQKLQLANITVMVAEILASLALMTLFNRSLLKLVNSMQSSMDIRRGSSKNKKVMPVTHITGTLSSATPLSINFPTETFDRIECSRNNLDINGYKSNSVTSMLVKTYQLNERQEKLMTVVVRTTILATISVMISMGFHLGFAWTYSYDKEIVFNLSEGIMRIGQCIYYLIQVLCLYLIYADNGKLYHSLCGSCNYICYCICVAWHTCKRKDKYGGFN